MKEEIQIIERDGKPEWAVLPYEEYLQLLDQSELLEDIRDFDTINAAIDRREEELIPAEVVYAILDGENPIKVWREYRELTQQQLADTAGISKPYLSQIETGKRKGTLAKAWIWRVLNHPDKKRMGEYGHMHYTKAIKERDGSILHVVVNPKLQPNRIVTFFFDRRLARD
jgi:transcriptional regulator with XRE-family HTH domain